MNPSINEIHVRSSFTIEFRSFEVIVTKNVVVDSIENEIKNHIAFAWLGCESQLETNLLSIIIAP